MTKSALISSINELDFFLRRQEFPEAAGNCLLQINNLYASFVRSWHPELVVDLVNHHIFGIFDRDVKRSRLSTTQKLELAEMILTHLSSRVPDGDRLVIFNAIFPSTYMYGGDIPLLLLSMVTSLAIATSDTIVLELVSVWMNHSGFDSQAVLYVANDVKKDFISDENPHKYDSLPKVCFQFTSVLLIAIGKIFHSKAPPPRLIRQVTVWIKSCPTIVFWVPHSSIFELFRWVISSENESELFLELLKSINVGGELVQQLQVIPHVLNLIQEISVKIANTTSSTRVSVSTIDLAEQWTDRLFQLIQMLIAAGGLDRNEIHPIFEAAQHARLPNTVFFEMMKNVYLK